MLLELLFYDIFCLLSRVCFWKQMDSSTLPFSQSTIYKDTIKSWFLSFPIMSEIKVGLKFSFLNIANHYI